MNKCSRCKKEWKHDESDIKPNGEICKTCKKCRSNNGKNCIKCKNDRAIYGFINDKKPSYCSKCRENNTINLKNNKCIKCNITRPSFGYLNKKATHCKKCKENDMINIKNNKCIKCNITRPSFGLLSNKKITHCKKCKTDDMINIKHMNNKCVICYKTRPSHGLKTDKKPTVCNKCKTKDMINLLKIIKCNKCNDKTPSFGYPNDTKATRCGKCKEENMIDIKSFKCIKCKLKSPVYGFFNDRRATLCSDCRKPDMLNIKHKRCIVDNCDKIITFDNYCSRCFYALNPNDERSKRVRLKENEVIKFIKENFINLEFIFDESIVGDGLCFKVRPDAILHLNNHSVIIECDEHQHKWYNNDCNIVRIHKIQEALNRPIIIIRFNPDDYIDENKKKIKSCFTINKRLYLTTIPKEQKELWKKRLEILKETIMKNIEINLEEPIKEIKLFYDNI